MARPEVFSLAHDPRGSGHARSMTTHQWPARVLPVHQLGAVVHGPVVVARSPGVVAALRCVFAFDAGLHLFGVVRCQGVQAEAASRQTFPRREGREDMPRSEPRLIVRTDGLEGAAHRWGSASGGNDQFGMELNYWVGTVPSDGRLHLEMSWLEVGLAGEERDLELREHGSSDLELLL